MLKKTNVFFCFLFLCISGCSINQYGDGYVVPENAKPSPAASKTTIPLNKFFYCPDSMHTVLFFTLNPQNVLFRKDPMSPEKISARLRLTFTIYTNSDKKEDIRKRSKIIETTKKELICDSIVLRHNKQDVFYEIEITDLNQRTSDVKKGWINKKTHFDEYTLLFYGEDKHFPLTPNQLTQKISAIRSEVNKNKLLYVSLYEKAHRAATPPFVINDKQGVGTVDSVFSLPPSGVFRPFSFSKPAYLTVRTKIKSESSQAVCVNPFQIEKLNTVVSCMQYISTREEFKRMQDSAKTQQAYEQFWINRAGGDRIKANKIEKLYLNRVIYANQNFTSYKPGWQTDRGIIYIVFGEPKQTAKKENTITWRYGGLVFNFNAITITKIPNNYRLNRSSASKAFWYQAVENWRAGSVVE